MLEPLRNLVFLVTFRNSSGIEVLRNLGFKLFFEQIEFFALVLTLKSRQFHVQEDKVNAHVNAFIESLF